MRFIFKWSLISIQIALGFGYLKVFCIHELWECLFVAEL